GATFTVRLPVFEGQPDLGAGQRPRDALAERASLPGLHVLIVEDDPDTASLLAEVVASSGAEARTAGSVREALDVLGRWQVDLLLSDIGMPGEDGYSLIRKVRQRESAQGAKAVPAIAITAYARAEDRQTELARLADTAGLVVAGQIVQALRRVHPATFVGAGKVEQIRALADQQQADVAIFDDPLSPAQQRNLEKGCKRKVIDRSALILDIFAQRARSLEGKMQVELAQLQYLLPRLTRQWTHLSRLGGGVGTRGPVETQL